MIKPKTLAGIIALPALIYVVLRGYLLSFTYDECWTYLGFASQGIVDIINNNHPAANNHILNSLLMKLSSAMFGISPLALRLPLIGAFILYLWSSFEVSHRWLKGRWIWLFVALVYQPYLLDYFVLARGYGLAITFMMTAILFTGWFMENGIAKNLNATLLFLFLTVYSNFTFLLILPGVFIFIGYRIVRQAKWKMFLPRLGVFVLALISALTIPILKLHEANEFYYGGDEGFFQSTLMSLAGRVLYMTQENVPLAGIMLGIITLATGAAIILMIKDRLNERTGILSAFMLFSAALFSIIQHVLIGTPYLIDRTAILLLPLMILAAFLLTALTSNSYKSPVQIGIAVLSVVNVLWAANLTHTIDFKENADMANAMQEIKRLSSEGEYSIGKSVYLNAPINYYAEYLSMDELKHVGLESCQEQGPHEFYLLFEKDTSCFEGKSPKLLKYYPVSKTYLYRGD